MKPYLIVLIAGLAAAAGPLRSASETGLERAERLTREGRVDSALAVYRELSESQPDTAVVHARVGGMLLLKQNYAEAIRSFQIAIGLDPENNGSAFIGLGIAYLHMGQYGAARAALMEARRLKPESAADLEQLVAWLDSRTSGTEGSQR